MSLRPPLSTVSTLDRETAKKYGATICFHLISSPIRLEPMGVNWRFKKETGTCLAVQLLRGFWQTFSLSFSSHELFLCSTTV